jgi:hypothetical protein
MPAKTLFFILGISSLVLSAQPAAGQAAIPAALQPFVRDISLPQLGPTSPTIHYDQLQPGITHVLITWDLNDSVHQDDLQVNIRPAFQPVFHWAPHLTPTDSNIIAQHVFRAPALIVQSATSQLVLLPDLDLITNTPIPWYLDMNAETNLLTIGLSNSHIKEHVLYYKKPGAQYAKGKHTLGFYLFTNKDSTHLSDPWREPLHFYWQRHGEALYTQGQPLPAANIPGYITQTYHWAFDSWKKTVWQEFSIDGKTVGAPVFIVNVTQSPNYKGDVNERETRSIWNQAWFNSLRSASGLYRCAREKHDTTLLRYANETKELALSFPQTRGFFCSVIATPMETITKKGKQLRRSTGWDHRYFGNSDRNPFTNEIRKSPYHVLDMSYTALLMLHWYDQLQKDPRLLDYTRSYADALLKIQRPDGFFPAWLTLDSLRPMGYLDQSPETSMSVTFLLTLSRITGDTHYATAAYAAMQAVIDNNIAQGQWEDFETYWSCSRYGSDTLIGRKVPRNDMYKQNTLSMYYTAEALYTCYQTSGKSTYLQLGRRVLDLLLMYQATWQPPYMYVNVLGGFGVMNADGEWNDSRQSLFAELILQYGKTLNEPEYTQRGLAALKASFIMMYSPLNPKTQLQYQQKWNFFGKEDYGFMMENYGHGGTTSAAGIGIGEFTIYDWGNGAAAEAYLRVAAHFGKQWLTENLK